MQETIRTTCPRDCYDACGIEVAKRDGAIRHVRGDRNHPVSRGRLCNKCATAYNGILLDPDARLLTPLLRDGPKGDGRFRPVSWEDALARIADRLSAIAERPGAETILNAHYTGTFALLGYHFPMRFMRRLGAREVDPDTICNKSGHLALQYLYGTSEDGFDPRTARDAACIVVWGANPSASAPHQHEHWLPEAPGRVVVVDSVATETARAADLHLQPFPGSDAALAFAIGHVISRDGLLDDELLAENSLGFEELAPLLADCTPQWGERVTGVPAEAIEQAARWYGTGPALLWIGQGFQRQPRGGNAVRAVAQLAALSGNLGRPGTGLLYLNGTGSRMLDEDYVSGAGLGGAGWGPIPEPISHMDLAACLEDPERSRALLCWNINVAASNPEQARLRRALSREDLFTVAVDLFATDTTDLADVVLPAASFLECDDIVASYFNLSLSAQVKAAEPIGESLPNPEIFRRLASAMGISDLELQESDAEVIAHLLRGTGTGLDFAELATRGTVWVSPEPRIQFEDLRFPTPSGRIELASDRAQADGRPRVAQPLADARPTAGRLRLLTPASRWTLNHSFANEPKLAGRVGPATVALHPLDAAERELSEGDRVVLRSTTGELELSLVLTANVPRGVAFSPKGRWPRLEEQGASVNVLNPGIPSDMGASTTVHGIEVSVTPAAGCDRTRGDTPESRLHSGSPVRYKSRHGFEQIHQKSGVSEMSTGDLKRTAFDSAEQKAGATWTDWEGWAWAADFGDPVSEHQATRTACSLWDESPLRKWDLRGPDALALADALFTNDMAALEIGQVRYGALCDEQGKMVMDGTVFRLADDHCLSVTSYDSDLDWFKQVASDRGLDVQVQDRTAQMPHLQVQGPNARKVLGPITKGADVDTLRYFRFVHEGVSVGGVPCWLSRTGYSGELGFEVYCAVDDAQQLWDAVVATGQPHGLRPIGLSAIEILRIESGLLFPDIDYFPHATDPYEVRLDNVIKLDKAGEFVGRDALRAIAAQGTPRLLTTLRIDGEQMPEYGAAVTSDGRGVGIVRSPCQSPTFDMQVIAMAAIERDLVQEGHRVEVAVGDGVVGAAVAPFPIYDTEKKRPRS